MTRIGIVGAGQFSGSFASLWKVHPAVEAVYTTDLLPERAEEQNQRLNLDGTFAAFEEMLASDKVDSIAIFTQRWMHGSQVIQTLEAGKHCYSAVPMAITEDEIARIVELVNDTGLIYMMGETSHYNAAVVWAREQIQNGDLGRVFYSEGDYVHDMDHGFYAAYQYSGGEDWKKTASYPPMLYPTHAVGGVLGATGGHAVSVSCIGVVDDKGDGVFDKSVSMFGNDWSNMSALFELADGGVMRTNEFRRVGYGVGHESRFRFYGTDKVFEQTSSTAYLTDREKMIEMGDELRTRLPAGTELDLEHVDPKLHASFASGTAPVHDRTRLPREFDGRPNGHEGSHHYLADDFVRAVRAGQQPPINAWVAARYTLPGIAAMKSASQGGARVTVADHGDCPFPIVDTETPWSQA